MKIRKMGVVLGIFVAAMLLAPAALPAEAESLEEQGTLMPPSDNSEEQGMIGQPSSLEESVFTHSEPSQETISWNPDWNYASFSQIHSGSAVLYHAGGGNGITVCVNAGHGTSGGSNVQTMCHPDGTPKVTGGSTAEGSVYAIAISSGATMADGTSEAAVNLRIALILKEKLLAEGFDVLMIRETDDVQLDNIARTVMANNNADCHIALHYDSTASDKGFFCIGVPDVASYRAMEPVASHWQEHMALAQSIVNGQSTVGSRLCGNGIMDLDLTQTSYSTIPSVDVECGDTVSDCSPETQGRIADGIVAGIRAYFGL